MLYRADVGDYGIDDKGESIIRTVIVISMVFFALLFLAGCIEIGPIENDHERDNGTGAPQPRPPQYGNLQGYAYISDGDQLQPSMYPDPPQNYRALVGADVIVEKSGHSARETETDTDGFFRIEDLDAGTWTLRVVSDELLHDYEQSVRIYVGDTTFLDGPDSVKTGRGYYLIVGVEVYEADGMRSYGAIDNATRMKEVFATDRADHDMAVSTKLLLDDNATYENIEEQIHRVMSKANPNDHFVLYFTGLGGGGTDADYLLPYDAVDTEPYDNVITDGRLRDMIYTEDVIDGFQGTHVTVLLDFDYSGTFVDGFETYIGDFEDQALLEHDRTTVIASGDYQSVYDDELNANPFTYFLAKGLKGPQFPADADGSGVINASELYDYVSDELYWFFQNRNGGTIPAIGGEYRDSRILRYKR